MGDPALDGGEGEPTIARDDFVRSARKSPEVAAALGVPTDPKAEQALDQLHRLKYDAPRDPEAGVGLRELALASYYGADWGARCGGPAPRRATPWRGPRICPSRSRRRSPRRSRASPTRPTTRSRCAKRLYLLKRVADLRSDDRCRRAHRPDAGTVALRAAHEPLPSVWCFTYFRRCSRLVPRAWADGAGRPAVCNCSDRRRPRVVGVARARNKKSPPRDRPVDRESRSGGRSSSRSALPTGGALGREIDRPARSPTEHAPRGRFDR